MIFLMVEEKVTWCERGAHRNGRFPAQAPAQTDQDDARRGRAAMAAYPLKQDDRIPFFFWTMLRS